MKKEYNNIVHVTISTKKNPDFSFNSRMEKKEKKKKASFLIEFLKSEVT